MAETKTVDPTIAAQAASQFNGLTPPQVKAILAAKYKSAGVYNPALQTAQSLGASQQAAVQDNPILRDAQLRALAQMSGIASQGMGAQDTLAMNQQRAQVQNQMRDQQAALQDQMAQRQIGGGGQELQGMLQLMGKGQDSAVASNANVMGDASRRGLEALAQTGQMAGNIRSQDFSSALAKGQAADQFSMANTQNQQNVNNSNVASQNRAQQTNLAQNQSIADQNLAGQRSELERQEQAKQINFNDQLNLAANKANALGGLSAANTAEARMDRQGAANVGAGAMSAFSSLAKYMNSNKSNNTDTTGST